MQKKSEKKGLTFNYKKVEYMGVNKRNSSIWKLRIVDIKIKEVQNIKYLGSVLTEVRKHATKIQRHTGIINDTLQKLNNV